MFKGLAYHNNNCCLSRAYSFTLLATGPAYNKQSLVCYPVLSIYRVVLQQARPVYNNNHCCLIMCLVPFVISFICCLFTMFKGPAYNNNHESSSTCLFLYIVFATGPAYNNNHESSITCLVFVVSFTTSPAYDSYHCCVIMCLVLFVVCLFSRLFNRPGL